VGASESQGLFAMVGAVGLAWAFEILEGNFLIVKAFVILKALQSWKAFVIFKAFVILEGI
jgi:hypothetical protein